MGDFPTSVLEKRPTDLVEAVHLTIRSFTTRHLDSKFQMTVHQGYRVQVALNKVHRAMEELEKAINFA